MKIADFGEFNLIEAISAGLINNPREVVKGIGDDTAVLSGDEQRHLLLTTDMLVEEVHFSFRFASPFQVGWKTVIASVSDIAAMGGQASNGVISLALPSHFQVATVQEIYSGIRAAAQKYNINIVGGDTVSTSGPLVINLAQLGWVEKEKEVYRAGARPGDLVVLSGTVGDSAGGLHLLQNSNVQLSSEQKLWLINRHLEPTAQSLLGKTLADNKLISAMNDISDGVASEIWEIASASGVGCVIKDEAIPISTALFNLGENLGREPIDWALYGGEDFQLIFTVPPANLSEVLRIGEHLDVRLSVIGEVTTAHSGLQRVGKGKAGVFPLVKGGYNHFD